MVRPRFAKLPPEQQRSIYQAALDEFTTHGFHEASLNRVIEAAGISKGSMYYYFDGKEDLYASLAQAALQRLLSGLGPFVVPDTDDPEVFWSLLEDYYLKLMIALADSPQFAALARGWSAVAVNPGVQQAQEEMERGLEPWLDRVLTAGQRAGAVRSDVSISLLVAVVTGMGQAMDVWLVGQQLARNRLPQLVETLMGMIRGAVAPRRQD